MAKKLKPGIFFGCIELSGPRNETHTDNLMGERYHLNYDNKTITRLKTNTTHEIYEWTDHSITFKQFQIA